MRTIYGLHFTTKVKSRYGQTPTVSKNENLMEVAELACLILLDPVEYSSESPQLLANV